MKFYGNGTVWNPENSTALCRFENGEFETSESNTISALISRGYEHDSKVETIPKEPEAKSTKKVVKK